MLSPVDEVVRSFEGEGHQAVAVGQLADAEGVARLHLEKLALDFLLLGALEAEKEFGVAIPVAEVLVVVGEHEVVPGDAVIVQVALRHEECLIKHVLFALLPALIIKGTVAVLGVHVVDDVHISVHNVAVHDLTSDGDVAEAVGQEQHEVGVVVAAGRVVPEVVGLVVLVEAVHVLHHDVVLELCHVEEHELESVGDYVVDLHRVVELGVDMLGVAHPGEVHLTGVTGADDRVVELKVEQLVHREGSDCGSDVDILVVLVVLFSKGQVDDLIDDSVAPDVTVGDGDGASGEGFDVEA